MNDGTTVVEAVRTPRAECEKMHAASTHAVISQVQRA
jgi:hypothetical protein